MLSDLESERLMPLLVKKVKKNYPMDTVACSCVGLHLVFFFQAFFSATFQFQFGQFAAFRIGFHDKKPHSATQKWMC